MREQGPAALILRFLRMVLLLDAGLAGAVGMIGYLRGWRTVEAYGSGLIWTGMLVIFIAALMGAGGFSARAGDVAAYTRSGAGDPSENIVQMAESRMSSLGCILVLLVAALGLVGIGYLIPLVLSIFASMNSDSLEFSVVDTQIRVSSMHILSPFPALAYCSVTRAPTALARGSEWAGRDGSFIWDDIFFDPPPRLL